MTLFTKNGSGGSPNILPLLSGFRLTGFPRNCLIPGKAANKNNAFSVAASLLMRENARFVQHKPVVDAVSSSEGFPRSALIRLT